MCIVGTVQATEEYDFVLQWGSFYGVGTGDGEFVRPEGVAVDSLGNVYVVDTYYVSTSSGAVQEVNNRIQKFDNNGTFITKWGSNGTDLGQFLYPKGIAIDQNDMVYVIEKNGNRVQKFTTDGVFSTWWGAEGSGPGQFNKPEAIAADSEGWIYVADTRNHRIQKFNNLGNFELEWGSQGSGNGQFNFPLVIATDSENHIYVGDENYRIQKFDANGTFITKWGFEGMADGGFTYPPSGAAVDGEGNLFVAEGQFYTGNRLLYRIQKFDENGTFITKWGYRGIGEGEFQYPRGVAVDQNGNVFVSDGWEKSHHHRIQKFALHKDEIIANFTADPLVGDPPLLVNFTDLSSGNPTSWQWAFGDGNTSESQNPGTIYTYPGIYNVSLTASNADTTHTITKESYITVNPLIANFTGDPREGDFPLVVNFTDTSTGTPSSWEWDFGDTATSTEQHPSHEYTAPGNYSVSLTVSNAGGNSTELKNEYIIARDWVKADFHVDITEGVAPLTVHFTDNSTGGTAPPDYWEWTFTNWDFTFEYKTNEQNPAYTFTIPDDYIIQLYVERDNLSAVAVLGSGIHVAWAPPVAGFTANITSGEAPLTVQFTDTSTGTISDWSWDFGDGVTSQEQNPLKTYGVPGVYTVSLNVTNEGGSSNETKIDYIAVTGTPTPPIANFSGSPRTGLVPLTVQFNDLSTRGPTQWFWDFGDGTNSTRQHPEKIYSTAGTYAVSLTVRNSAGSDSESKTGYIIASDPVPPVAHFTGTPGAGFAPLTVRFQDESTGFPTSWFWEFGDGTNATEQHPEKVYTTAGTYTVSLNVTNDAGSSLKTRIDYIRVSDPVQPQANFTGTPTNGTAPLTVRFTDLSTGFPTSWLWEFGDGTNSTEQHPLKIYNHTGTYTVILNVSNSEGSSSIVKDRYITVTEIPVPPVANFTGTPTVGIGQLTVRFTDLSTGSPTSWLWEFGDGTNATEQHPEKTYGTIGSYTVSLRASNAEGSNTQTKQAYINVIAVPTPGNYTFTTEWGSRGAADGQFVYPEGLALDHNGALSVVDQGNNRIQTFDVNGSFISTWGSSGSGDGEFDVPRDICVDADGHFYVTDTWNARVQKFDETGSFISAWGSYGFGEGQFSSLYGVAADSESNIYVTDRDRVQKFDSNGTFLLQWGTTGSGEGQFNSAMGIAVDSDSTIYVVDWGNNRVQTFGSDGSFIAAWGSHGSGEGQFAMPKGIAADIAGHIYVADTQNHRIQVFDGNGTYLTQIGSYGTGEGQFNEPFDVLVDRFGNLIVSDARNHRIQVFSPTIEGMPAADFTATPTSGETPLSVRFTDESSGDITTWQWTFGDGKTSGEQNPTNLYTTPGVYTVSLTVSNAIGSDTKEKIQYINATPPPEHYRYVSQWGSYGDGRFLYPKGTAVDPAGNIYVVDAGNDRVQKFDQNGTFLLQWKGGGGWWDGDLLVGGAEIAVDFDGFVYLSQGSSIKKYDADGTFMSQWGSYGSGEGQFQDARGIAIDANGTLYVADYSVNRIQTFTSDGTFIRHYQFSQGSGDGEFGLGPVGISIDTDGAMYITDFINNRVQKFDQNGTFLATWGSYGTGTGLFRNPTGIQIDGAGDVNVVDSWNNRIQTFTKNGAFIRSWGSRGDGDGQFDVPQDIAIDSSGNIYVTDYYNNRIQKFDSTATFITTWGSEPPGDGSFYHPEGVSVDNNDFLYLADTNNHQIQIFDNTGTFIRRFGEQGSPTLPGEIPVDEANGKFNWPKGVAVDSNGFIYVADTGNSRIQKFDSNGTFITKWGGWPIGSDDGHFDHPQDIAVGGDGYIYVADTGNNRIQKFDANGTYITKWTSSNPYGVAIDQSVYVYVASGGSIRKFDSNGTFIRQWGSTSSLRVATDSEGSVYATDTFNNQIRKYTGNGVFITNWGEYGDGNGEFDVPGGITVDGNGTVFVADAFNNRIQAFSSFSPVPAPIAGFTANITSGYAPLTVRFNDTSSGDPTGWLWQFGDGTTSGEQHPVKTFGSNGTYTISLTASNSGGSNTTTKMEYISVHIRADFNRNNRIDIGDVAKVAWMAAGLVGEDLEADFDGDGHVTGADAAKIAYFYVGKIHVL